MDLKAGQIDPDTILDKIQTVRALRPPNTQTEANEDLILETLLQGRMALEGLMPWSSNYTFLATLKNKDESELLAIYKPGEGERPLWDFPDRTLAQREFASYLVSQLLGWPSIPATILRDGPHGPGSVQLFVEAEYEAHYFNMRDTPGFTEDFRRIALFDYIVNNADRKGGHCIKGKQGKIWAIDHGLTFHTDPKLRTVIWDFCDEPVPDDLLTDLARLQKLLQDTPLCQIMTGLINRRELESFKRRINHLVSTGQFPPLRRGRNMPFPPI